MELLQSDKSMHGIVDDGFVSVLDERSKLKIGYAWYESRTHHPYLLERILMLQGNDVLRDWYELHIER